MLVLGFFGSFCASCYAGVEDGHDVAYLGNKQGSNC